METCKICGKEIEFLKIMNGKYIAVDVKYIEVYTDDGNIHIAKQRHTHDSRTSQKKEERKKQIEIL
jgi:ribosome-binding protein aMBF1 (putative translation factor)